MVSKTLKKEDIGALIDSKIEESRAWYGNKLSKEREKVIKYYNGELPRPISLSDSPYISRHVYTSVQNMKAQLTQTFSAGSGIIRFKALGPKDVQTAQIATDYTNWLFYDSPYNDGERIIRDLAHDGLIGRASVCKVYYKEHHEFEEREFEHLLQEDLDDLINDPTVVKVVVNEDEDAQVFSGTLTKRHDKSHIKVEVLAPEEFYLEPNATELSEKHFCVHSTTMPLDELIEMYPDQKSKIESMWASDEYQLSTNPERLARFNQIDAGFRLNGDDAQDELRQILVNECYTRLKLEGDDRARLYKVVRVGNVTMEVEPCALFPFVGFVPLPVPHSFYGDNFAAISIPTQNMVTGLSRQVIKHAEITNNPRLQIKKGTVIRESEIKNQAIGGIVNVNNLDGIAPIPQAGLNPYVFTLLQSIEQRQEQETGVSLLSMGMNKDAVSEQNSAGLMEQQINLGQVRQKEIARSLSETLITIYQKLYELCILFEDRKSIVEVTGGWAMCNPSEWQSGRIAKASAHLGYGERDADANKTFQFLTAVAHDPDVNQMIGPQGRSNAIQYILKVQNKGDMFSQFFPNPWQSVKPPQPNPKDIAEAQSLSKQADAKMAMAQAQMEKVQGHNEMAAAKQKLNEMQAQIDMLLKQRKEMRQDLETSNRIDISQREMKIEEAAPHTEPTKNIVSPNG